MEWFLFIFIARKRIIKTYEQSTDAKFACVRHLHFIAIITVRVTSLVLIPRYQENISVTTTSRVTIAVAIDSEHIHDTTDFAAHWTFVLHWRILPSLLIQYRAFHGLFFILMASSKQ